MGVTGPIERGKGLYDAYERNEGLSVAVSLSY